MDNVHVQDDQQELALAAELQAALLPKAVPHDFPHLQAAARNAMCRHIGGDFYDFVRINEDQLGVVVGDVIGHGVQASLVMAQIMGFLRSEPSKRSRPQQVVDQLNRMLLDLGDKTNTQVLCTLIYGVIDAPSGIGLFVNAGHPAPLVCTATTCAAMCGEGANLLLGVEPYPYSEICRTFVPGERLILYTDGLLDARNAEGEFFCIDRLLDVVRQHLRSDPRNCAEAVFRSVAAFRSRQPQVDDETIVVIDRV